MNTEHGIIASTSYNQVELKKDLDDLALNGDKMKSTFDMPNFNRSPHQYTAITNYQHDLSNRRVFAMDGKMQLLRQNIRN